MKVIRKYHATSKRFLAFAVDIAIIISIWAAICLSQYLEILTVSTGVRLNWIAPLYFILYETVSKGSTIGKALLGIRIRTRYKNFERPIIFIRSSLFWIIFYPASPLELFPSTYEHLGIIPFGSYYTGIPESTHIALYLAFYFSLPVFILVSCILPNKGYGLLDYLCGTTFDESIINRPYGSTLYYLKYYLLVLFCLVVTASIIKYEVPDYLYRNIKSNYERIGPSLQSDLSIPSSRIWAFDYRGTRSYLFKGDKFTFLSRTAVVDLSFANKFPVTKKEKIDTINILYSKILNISDRPKYVLFSFSREYKAGLVSLSKVYYTFIRTSNNRFTYGPRVAYSTIEQKGVPIPAYPRIYNDTLQIELRSGKLATAVLKERKEPRTQWRIELKLSSRSYY